MTAVVGILNKTAVALAADSAVTVTGENGRKIFNTANKIFKLSKFHPIGIAIYNSASLVRTPWEIIIKSYREQLNGNSFEDVEGYKNDFLKYLTEHPEYISTESQRQRVGSVLGSFVLFFDQRFKTSAPIDTSESTTITSHFVETVKGFINTYIEKMSEAGSNEGLGAISEEEIDEFLQSMELEQIFSDFNVSDSDLKELYVKLVKIYLKSDWYLFQWSGLVFCGYGSKQIFPSLVSVKVGEVINNIPRFSTQADCKIDDDMEGAILPFAQTDVIETIIEGVSPDMADIYTSTIRDFLGQYSQRVLDLLNVDTPEAQKVREGILGINTDDLVQTFVERIDEAKKSKNVDPTVQTVSILSKEDLGEMAESLIYMTYLKRRIMSDEESVGGPVDVAIISRTDGFIWIKRKFYFKTDLNPHFLHNYYNNH